MRNRLTKQAMGKNDSPTTMHVDYENPELSKYESGDPESWAEGVHKDTPWKSEKREETGHPSMKGASKNVYADAVKEAQELEAKALRCLKMAETFLGDDAPSDVIERQAVDFMTMSNKSVLATLRRMREFEENISEARVAKVVDAVLEVIAEEEEEKEHKEEEKKASEEDEDSKIAAIVEATLEVLAEEKEEEEKKAEKEEMKEEKHAAEEKEEEKKAEKEEMKEEKKEASDDLVNKITAAVLAALGKQSGMKEEEEEKKAEKEEMKEEKHAADEKEEEKKAEKEEMKEEKHAADEKEEEKKAEKEEMKEEEKKAEKEEMKEEKHAAEEISFEDGYDVTASDEDAALLSQLFTTKDAGEDFSEKEAKIKTLKNVTASTDSGSEIDKLASLWNKEF
jgi:hypothetical protein